MINLRYGDWFELKSEHDLKILILQFISYTFYSKDDYETISFINPLKREPTLIMCFLNDPRTRTIRKLEKWEILKFKLEVGI